MGWRLYSNRTEGEKRDEIVPVEPGAHDIRVRPERGGRGGKTVTTAAPFFLSRGDANALLKELKRSCGGGGTVKSDRTREGRACWRLELQGDHVERVVGCLTERGYPVKRGGG